MSRTGLNRVAIFGALLVATTGCVSSLLETNLPIPSTYVLNAAPSATGAEPAAPTVDLTVSQATPTPGLKTERIAVLHEARRLDYYKDAQWGAALPEVVQAMVVGSLQNQKWFRSVTVEQARVESNYWLELEVRDFQAEYTTEDAAPTVRVTLVGSVIRIKDRKLIGILPATVSLTAAENRLGAVITAFESAAQQASLSIGRQAVIAINGIKTD
jgi:cholesterol transport system auxiliary component